MSKKKKQQINGEITVYGLISMISTNWRLNVFVTDLQCFCGRAVFSNFPSAIKRVIRID